MTPLTHWDPFRAFPPSEGAETDTEVSVTMMVPSVEKGPLDISVSDSVLRVRREIRNGSQEQKENHRYHEIRDGDFECAVRLPAAIDAAQATADLTNGMLKVTLPKTKASNPLPIEAA